MKASETAELIVPLLKRMERMLEKEAAPFIARVGRSGVVLVGPGKGAWQAGIATAWMRGAKIG
jgi:hypothetical protein